MNILSSTGGSCIDNPRLMDSRTKSMSRLSLKENNIIQGKAVSRAVSMVMTRIIREDITSVQELSGGYLTLVQDVCGGHLTFRKNVLG